MPMHTCSTYLRNNKFASCSSSKIERDNCCQRERSGGKDIPPIRNTMHKVKLHKTAFMANRVKWIRCKLQVIVVFSAKFGEKKSRSDIVKTFNDQLHLKTWYADYLWKTTFYMEKHSKINTITKRTTNGCGYASHVVTVDIVPSRANPPGGANMLQFRLQTQLEIRRPKCATNSVTFGIRPSIHRILTSEQGPEISSLRKSLNAYITLIIIIFSISANNSERIHNSWDSNSHQVAILGYAPHIYI